MTISPVVWSATYDAFGKATVDVSSTVINNLRFPGQYYDAETGLHYNWKRYYDPTSGRYVKTDPIGFRGGLNLYAYVFNNPLLYLDPYGLGKICRSGPFNWAVSDTPGGYDFSDCCKKHDFCYDGLNDDGTERLCKPKNKCDDEFKKCMRENCQKYP